MKKTRFFYGTNCLLLAFLGWGILFNTALEKQILQDGNMQSSDMRSSDMQSDGVQSDDTQSNHMQSDDMRANATQTDDVQTSDMREENVEISEKNGAEEGKTTPKKIRVLLMDSGYRSYEHAEVSGVCKGKVFSYTADSQEFGSGPVTLNGGKKGIEVTSIERQCGNPVYYGKLELIRNGESLNLINELSLEEYLKGVVPSEMPSSYEKQALMAQAVCARTYAWKQMQGEGVSGYPADVDDSVSYQVYGNIQPQESTSEAVEETKGLILTREGEPIEAYYFSTSAGATSTDEIWGAEEAAPYLKSVVCEFDENSPWREWKVTIPWENLQQKVSERTGTQEKLLSVEVVRKNESGAAISLQVVTESGDFSVDQEYEIRKLLSPQGCTITEKDGTETDGGSLLPSAYFTLKQKKGESVEVTGGGYGHGVGMSQTAANEMAKEEYSFEEILKYFFNGITIESMV